MKPWSLRYAAIIVIHVVNTLGAVARPSKWYRWEVVGAVASFESEKPSVKTGILKVDCGKVISPAEKMDNGAYGNHAQAFGE